MGDELPEIAARIQWAEEPSPCIASNVTSKHISPFVLSSKKQNPVTLPLLVLLAQQPCEGGPAGTRRFAQKEAREGEMTW